MKDRRATAHIGDGGISAEVIAERESNTDLQREERAGQAQNIRVSVAGPN